MCVRVWVIWICASVIYVDVDVCENVIMCVFACIHDVFLLAFMKC